MYARVSRLDVPIDKLDEEIKHADETQREVAQIPGSQGLYYLVDRETGKMMAVALWESELAMRDSETSASKVRQRVAERSSAKVVSVERYEVVTSPAKVPAGERM